MFQPSIRQMQYLIALQNHGSFSKAAEMCFVTQSTLSAGIKELENILGQNVVDRSRRKPSLTPLGLELAHDWSDILHRLENTTERARQLSSPMSGPMRLGIIPTIAPYMLPSILPRIEREFPQLEMQLHEDVTARLLDKLRAGQLDLVLMAFPYDTPDLVQLPLFEEQFYLALPAGYTTDPEQKTTMSKLEPDKLLLLEDGHCLRDHALDACGIQAVNPRKTFSATSLPTLIQMVSHGYGMTLLPEMAAVLPELPETLRLERFESPPPTREIGLTWRHASPRAPDFKALGELISKII